MERELRKRMERAPALFLFTYRVQGRRRRHHVLGAVVGHDLGGQVVDERVRDLAGRAGRRGGRH